MKLRLELSTLIISLLFPFTVSNLSVRAGVDSIAFGPLSYEAASHNSLLEFRGDQFVLNNGGSPSPRLMWKGGVSNEHQYLSQVSEKGELCFFPQENGEGSEGAVNGNVLKLAQDGNVVVPFNLSVGQSNQWTVSSDERTGNFRFTHSAAPDIRRRALRITTDLVEKYDILSDAELHLYPSPLERADSPQEGGEVRFYPGSGFDNASDPTLPDHFTIDMYRNYIRLFSFRRASTVHREPALFSPVAL